MVDKIVVALDGEAEGKVVALLGLSFKPETDDIREAPAIDIARALQARGAIVRAYDPAAIEQAATELPEIITCKDAYEALAGSHAAAIVTEWNEFRRLDLDRVKQLMVSPRLVDMRNIYDAETLDDLGFEYTGVGVARGPAHGALAQS